MCWRQRNDLGRFWCPTLGGEYLSERSHEGRTDQADRQAFICYAHEDSENVDKLQRRLEEAGIPVWRDRDELWPGENWDAKIRRAITDNAFVFIACFSRASLARVKSYQNEELTQAAEQARLRSPDDIWIIPVRFDECDIPDLIIGAGRTFRGIHRADIFGHHEHKDIERLVESILRILPRTADVSTVTTPNYAPEPRQKTAAKHGENERTDRRARSRGVPRHAKTVPSGIQQHETHSTLARQARPQDAPLARLDLDAIIVPASRPAEHLDHAVTLARAAGCWLLILCSQQLRSAEACEFLATRSFHKAKVIDLPPGYSHELLYFPGLLSIKDELPVECGFYATDLSMKRNIGLVLARMVRWRRVFFLDDDIRDITYPDLQSTVDMLGSFSAAGLRVTDFPDNSIVGHANRMTGGSQDVFVSGAALAVDCEENIGFFPDIHNEDWLFFFDVAARGRLANSGPKATQLAYDPFANPDRAAWQEFGEVIAEGLYTLLHLDLAVQHATREYWSYFLKERRDFLETILTRSHNAHPDMRRETLLSVEWALQCMYTIKPIVCEQYVRLWRQDLADWKQQVAGIPAMSSVEEALREMGLASRMSAGGAGKILPRLSMAASATMPGPAVIPQFSTLKRMSEHASVRDLSSAVPAEEKRDTKSFPVLTAKYQAMLAARANGSYSLREVDEADGRQRRQRLGTAVSWLASAWPWRRSPAPPTPSHEP